MYNILTTMAAIVRHILQKTGQSISIKYEFLRYSTTSINYKKVKTINPKLSKRTDVGPRINSVAESIASKGFLRSYKPYSPPNNVTEEIRSISKELNLAGKPTDNFQNLTEKCLFLLSCSAKFNHSVPNSQLYQIKTISDAIEFYSQPVNTTLPLDNLIAAKLPENLHIIQNYHRFQTEGDTDTLFKGQTAFPKSSTLVTGLKYRKKYIGHVAKSSWP